MILLETDLSVNVSLEEEEGPSQGTRKRMRSQSRSSTSGSSSEDNDEVRDLKIKIKKLEEEYEGRQKWIQETMEDILHIVDTMVEKVGMIVNTKDCSKCGYMELKKKICAIDKYLDTNPIVMKLEDVVK